jgi:hypothetical protein
VLRPAVLRVGGDPVPGVCAGLQRALLGMRAGGKRTVRFGPELGFGAAPAMAPMAVVPGGAALTYAIELLRVSTRGPDELTKVDCCCCVVLLFWGVLLCVVLLGRERSP